MSGPDPDGRRRDDLLDHARQIAPYYTDEWDPDGDDAGAALLRLFAELGETVTERVDRLPEKHRIAFYDTLGFSQRPPQAARLPLSVTVTEGVPDNVTVPAGTQAIGGTPEQTVEVLEGDGFEATPARLESVYSVAPEEGEIYDHADLLTGGDAALFRGDEGRQEHLLHVGHAGQLTVEASVDDPATIRVTTTSRTSAKALANDLVWEFYGERDGKEDWHRVNATAAGTDPRTSAASRSRARPADRRGISSTERTTDGTRPYETGATRVVRALSTVVAEVDATVDPEELRGVVEALGEVLDRLGAGIDDETVQGLLDDLLTALDDLARALQDGPVEAAASRDLERAIERFGGDLDAETLSESFDDEVEPAVRELVAAFRGGPLEGVLRRELAPAVESLVGSFENAEGTVPLEAALEDLSTALEEGRTTGALLADLQSRIEENRFDIPQQMTAPVDSDEAIDDPVSALFRALAGLLDDLREVLGEAPLAAVIRALALILARLRDVIREGELDEPLDAIAVAIAGLRAAIDAETVVEAVDRSREALRDRIEATADGPVGDAVEAELRPAVEALFDVVRADPAARELVRALLDLADALVAGRSGAAVREAVAERIAELADTIETSPLDDEAEQLVAAIRALAETLGEERERHEEAVDRARRALLEPFEANDGAEPDDTLARRRIDVEIDGTPAETVVDGIESKWIRVRLPESAWGSDLLSTRFGEETPDDEYVPPVEVGPVPSGSVSTDALLTNDTEREIGEDGIDPLGQVPRQQDAFYVASEEAFTKSETTVAIVLGSVLGEQVDFDIDPEVAWEYWDGDAWARLNLQPSVDGAVKNLLASGTVAFAVPDDLEATAVAGHDGHWIRARLVDGSYGRYEARTADDDSESERRDEPGSTEQGGSETWVTEHAVQPPQFATVSVRFVEAGLQRPAAHLVSRNNLAYGRDVVAARRSRFRPFVGPPDETQTLYLGFDRPLEDGPLAMLFDVRDVQYSEGFHPRLRWERQGEGGRWQRVDTRDGTESLTERGVVRVTVPDATTATSRFGEQRHWLRARVDGSRFVEETSENGPSDGEQPEESCLDPCGRTVRVDPPAGEPGEEPPELQGLYPNTGWAHNVRTIENERLGSSDGSQDQTMRASERPALNVDLRVDELAALSEPERRRLRASEDHDVEVDRGPDGEVTAFWVKWAAVRSLVGSDGDDRHYTIDPVAGRIGFGDGNDGRIPPRGRDSVRATYRTGGGTSGNVPAGAIEELKTAIPFVDAVTNPLPADGGADEEPIEGVIDRAPKELRDRGRAVTAADVERIALDASRQLARVECLPAMDRGGNHAPGWVTLLVVPTGPGEKPVPSVTLREQVYRSVSERAAATLVADPEQLVVRGPSYVPVSVEVDLAATGVGSLSRLEETARSKIATFLHPLSGGSESEGWAFSETPCHSDLYALLEGIDGVDHVEDLVFRFQGSDSTVTVRDGDPVPSMSADALVHSGTHDVRARRANRTGGA